MQALFYTSQLLGLVAFAAYIWLVVRGFKRGPLWGVGVLLLSPFTATAFGVVFWQEEKKPFLLYISSFVIAVALGLVVFTSWGGWGVFKVTQRVHEGIVQRDLTEKDAVKFMRANMDFIENANLSQADREKLALMREMVDDMEGGMTEETMRKFNEDALQILETSDLTDEQRKQLREYRKQVEPSPPAAATPKPDEPVKSTTAKQAKVETRQEMDPREIIRRRYGGVPRHHDEYRLIDLAQAKRYINAPVIVTRMDGAEQKATLIEVDGRRLQFEQRLPGGRVTFRYNDYEIKSLQVPRGAR